MVVYTRVLAQGITSAAGPTILYTAPDDGTTTVVRDIVLDATEGSGRCGIETISPGDDEEAVIFAVRDLVPFQSYHWSGRQAMNAGEKLAIFRSGGVVLYRITGYVLS